ncbi:lysophospholipid acyltransferase family protein [Plantactinospora sp. GCM10030261]|uniref:lysophospholipid acyltransferase family protein n=1 Tax=Plantactinospora sp. GCM10030261 TaxID=3273420 RepID=UPI003607910C
MTGTSTVPESPWQPRSSCGPGCQAGGQRAAGPLRQAIRLVALLGALLGGVCLLPVLLASTSGGRQVAGRWWARLVLRSLGIGLTVGGVRLPRRRALLVANHISWLDVIAIMAVAPTRMVAKSEVRRWPVLGVLAAAAGTIFVDRSRPRALPGVVAEIAAAVRAGAVVTAFPEGTTWCGVPVRSRCAGVGRFRPAVFQAAADAGAVVVPLTLTYRTTGAITAAPAFLGDDTLWASLRRVLALRRLVVSVTAAPVLHLERGADRRTVARMAQSSVGRGRPTISRPTPVTPSVAGGHTPAVPVLVPTSAGERLAA